MLYLISIFFFLFTFSCNKPSPSWQNDHIIDGNQYSSKLIYPIHSGFTDLEIEFVRIKEDLYAYINLHNRKIDSSQHFYLLIDENKYENIGFVCKGEQKIVIEKDISYILLKALKEEKKIALYFNNTEIFIESSNFKKHYAKFVNQNHYLEQIMETFR
jgi:hypothetical protein